MKPIPLPDLTQTIEERSAFFDPSLCEYRVHGFFEELVDVDTNKVYGVRVHRQATRPLGSLGREVQVLTQDEWLHKGTRQVLLRASKAKPKKVWAMLQAICGSLKPKQNC